MAHSMVPIESGANARLYNFFTFDEIVAVSIFNRMPNKTETFSKENACIDFRFLCYD